VLGSQNLLKFSVHLACNIVLPYSNFDVIYLLNLALFITRKGKSGNTPVNTIYVGTLPYVCVYLNCFAKEVCLLFFHLTY
jgi:hypothetical protein